MNDGDRASAGRGRPAPASRRRWLTWGAETLAVAVGFGVLVVWRGAFQDSWSVLGMRVSPMLLEVALILMAARLAGQLWAPGGTPPSVFRSLQMRFWLLRSREQTVRVVPPWQEGSWRMELAIAAGLLVITAAVRWVAATALYPNSMPNGADYSDYLWNAWLLLHDSWSGYSRMRFPGYPWLTAQVTLLGGGTLIQGALTASRWAMTFGVLGIYAAVRLTLGRRAALTAGLLFAFSSFAQSYATATTSYGLFTGMVSLYAGALAAALFFRRRWLWFAAGIAFGLVYVVDVKAVTVAAVSAPFLVLAVAWARRDQAHGASGFFRRWGGVIAGPGIGLAAALLAVAAVHLTPVEYTPLKEKLDIQAVDIVRSSQPELIKPNEDRHKAWAHLPPLGERLRLNLRHARQLLYGQGWLLLPLALLGCLAPLAARGKMAWRQRLLGMVGPALMMALIASAAGAFSLLFLYRYVLHVWPFFLALTAAGAWVLAGWAAPARAPRLLVEICGWAMTACLVAAVSGNSSLGAAMEQPTFGQPRLGGMPSPDNNEEEVRHGREIASWLLANRPADEVLVLCERGHVAAFLPRAIDIPPAGNPDTSKCSPPAGASARERTWIVDTEYFPGTGQLILSRPSRFETVLWRRFTSNPRPRSRSRMLIVAVERIRI